MKMNHASKVLIFFLLLTRSSFAEELKCVYFGIFQNYMCEMSNVFNETQEITSVSGEHAYGKGVSDVNAFYVKRESLTKYIPTKVCNFLVNLKIMNINGYALVNLKKQVFAGCQKLEQISLENIDFKELDEDLLSEAPAIERFLLAYSKVEVLKKNFFKNNQKLTLVALRSNNLKIIETEFPSTITHLSVTNNLCVNGAYSEDITLNLTLSTFTQKIYDKCSNKTYDDESVMLSYETIKMRIFDEQTRDNRDKIMSLRENFQTTSNKMSLKIMFDHERNYEKYQIMSDFRSVQNQIDKFQLSFKYQQQSVMRTSNKLETDAKYLESELERRSKELEEINIDLFSKVHNIYVVIIFLMCIQVLMACGLAVYRYHKR